MSIVYSFDLESKEPIAMKTYSGNVIDKRAVVDFVRSFSLNNAILVMGKGFNSKGNLEAFKSMDGLTYILPLRRNDALLDEHGMYEGISSPLNTKDAAVLSKSKKMDEDTHLYSFRDPSIAGDEEIGYMKKHQEKDGFDNGKYERDKKEFGVISFISNKDLSCEEVYEAYMSRWEIEIMFNMMKDIVDLDTVNVHSDYSVIASEFINYLAIIISQRIKRLFNDTLLEGSKGKAKTIADAYSYRQTMKFLSKIKKIKQGNGEWETNYPSNCKYIQELGECLGV